MEGTFYKAYYDYEIKESVRSKQGGYIATGNTAIHQANIATNV